MSTKRRRGSLGRYMETLLIENGHSSRAECRDCHSLANSCSRLPAGPHSDSAGPPHRVQTENYTDPHLSTRIARGHSGRPVHARRRRAASSVRLSPADLRRWEGSRPVYAVDRLAVRVLDFHLYAARPGRFEVQRQVPAVKADRFGDQLAACLGSRRRHEPVGTQRSVGECSCTDLPNSSPSRTRRFPGRILECGTRFHQAPENEIVAVHPAVSLARTGRRKASDQRWNRRPSRLVMNRPSVMAAP